MNSPKHLQALVLKKVLEVLSSTSTCVLAPMRHVCTPLLIPQAYKQFFTMLISYIPWLVTGILSSIMKESGDPVSNVKGSMSDEVVVLVTWYIKQGGVGPVFFPL